MKPGYVNGVRIVWPDYANASAKSKRVCANGHVDDFTPSGRCRECSRDYNRRHVGLHREEVRARSRESMAAKRAAERAAKEPA